ncbi:MAG: helix-turn-helix domain-containing protein [Acetobacter sp.]|uniref:helix-turn-helix domain-containing protein n=1 Tax=Acetobacter sp. TaxID=440 RepID=UPI003F8F3BC2
MAEEDSQLPNWAVQIQEARKAKGWTQEKLAEELSVSQSTITDWERARTFPRHRNIYFLSKVLGIKIRNEVEVDMKVMSKKSKADTLQGLAFQDLSKSKQLDLFIERFSKITMEKCEELKIGFPIQAFSKELIGIWMRVNDPLRGLGASSVELRLEDFMQEFLSNLEDGSPL